MKNIIVKKSKYGKGVFADELIKKGTIIEKCPIILMPISELSQIKKTKLYYYYFEYNEKYFAIVLGFGSIYNHSFKPNAKYLYDYSKKLFIVKALKNIEKGKEIFFNYNYHPNDKTPLPDWFKLGINVI